MRDAPGGPTSSVPAGVCVLGTHRSGTSLVAGLLEAMGVDFGPESQLLEPQPDNPKGFWEHREVREIDDEILARFGGTWYEPPELPAGFERAEELADLRRRARELLDRDLRASGAWGVKDPRICLTLPFWRVLAPGMRYVVCIRGPLEVARSLEARDRLSLDRGGDLWIRYVAAALRHTRASPRMLLFYEDVIADWRTEVAHVARFLERKDPTDDPDTVKRVEQLIEPGLRHHRASLDEMAAESSLPVSARSLYLMLRLAGDLDTLGDEIDSFSDVALRMSEDETRRRRRLAEAEAELGDIRERLSGRERELEALLRTRTFRYTAWLRALYGRFRSLGRADPRGRD